MSDALQPLTIVGLKQIAPFKCLPEESLAEFASSTLQRSLKVGELVISEDTAVTKAPVYAILSGRVRIVETEQLATVRHLRAGEIFGHYALLRNLPPPYRAEVSHNAVILEIPSAALFQLFAQQPFIARWFQADLRRFERELGAFDDVAGSQFLFGQQLGELDHAAALVCDATQSIRSVATLMSEHGRDCVIITDGDRMVGMLSDSDLRDRVVATGQSVDSPVAEVMTTDLLTIRSEASVFEGMMAMEQRSWQHLILLDNEGLMKGLVSDADLARAWLASPAALRRRLGDADSGSALRELRAAADQAIVTLYRRGVRAKDLLKINTRFNDALTVRVLEIVRAAQPEPPAGLRWCWLSLGSEGRGEMGLRTDQDNAIVYDCVEDDAANDWLGAVARAANAMLNEAGIALCDGGIMAQEAPMRQNLEGWRASIEKWMSDPDDARMLWVGALMDCRPVDGDRSLYQALKQILLKALQRRRNFSRVLAREALAPGLPLKRLPMRLKGTRSDAGPTLHLKRHGAHLITNAARLLCLSAGWLEQSGTEERLTYLAESDRTLRDIARESIVAYGVLSDLRMSWHVEQISRGEPLSDIMPLWYLGETRKRLLIGAYQSVDLLQLRIRRQFGVDR